MKKRNILFSGRNVPVNVAAKIMHKDPMFVRKGLQNGFLPFGTAFKKPKKVNNMIIILVLGSFSNIQVFCGWAKIHNAINQAASVLSRSKLTVDA